MEPKRGNEYEHHTHDELVAVVRGLEAEVERLREERDESRAKVTRLDVDCDRLRKRTVEGCHWACLDGEDDDGLPMPRSHHPDCVRQRLRLAEDALIMTACMALDKVEK